MTLLSTLAAHDLGYLTTGTLIRRIDSTLTTLEGLERYEGHFLNWYDTATLASLHPRYVSTVDSGNLAAALIALAQGLVTVATKPQTSTQQIEGVIDAADLLVLAASSRAQVIQLARDMVSHARRALAGGDTGALTAVANELPRAVAAISQDGSADSTDIIDIIFWADAVAKGIAAVNAEHVPESDAALHRLA